MEKRYQERFTTKLMVKIQSGAFRAWGLCNNISENGLFIRTNIDIPLDTKINMELLMPNDEVSKLKGLVIRIIKFPQSKRKNGLGIMLLEKDSKFTYYVKSLPKATDNKLASCFS